MNETPTTKTYDAAGNVCGLRMTRRAFRALSKDYRNSPRRGEAPTAITQCLHRGTVLVQVQFVCAHDVLEKVACAACDEREGA